VLHEVTIQCIKCSLCWLFVVYMKVWYILARMQFQCEYYYTKSAYKCMCTVQSCLCFCHFGGNLCKQKCIPGSDVVWRLSVIRDIVPDCQPYWGIFQCRLPVPVVCMWLDCLLPSQNWCQLNRMTEKLVYSQNTKATPNNMQQQQYALKTEL